MPLMTLWALAVACYRDRLEPNWSRRSAPEAQAVFDHVGLTGAFWNLSNR